MIGLNVDHRHFEDMDALAADVAATGATIVRTVLKPDAEGCYRWVQACHGAGLEVLGVVAKESFFLDDGSELTHAEAAGLYSSITNLDAYQIGNEPDQHSDSSWTMTQDELNALLREFKQPWYAYLASRPHIGPGLASGQAAWLKGVDTTLFDAIALHPYQESVETIDFYLSTYRAYWDGPIWFTEFADVGMTRTIAERGECAIKFCYHRYQGFGLIDEHGQLTADGRRFQAIAKTEVPVMAGQMEQQEKADDWKLGPRWESLAIEEWKRPDGNTMRRGHYRDGVAEEIVAPDGKSFGVWPFRHRLA